MAKLNNMQYTTLKANQTKKITSGHSNSGKQAASPRAAPCWSL